MIDLRKTLLAASQVMNREGIKHALIGGFALAAYSINRATADVDFLADGSRRRDIISSLSSIGFHLRFEAAEVLHFSGPGALDILLANRPASLQMLEDSRLESSLSVRVLRAEDIIGLKIQAYVNEPARELQDKADIQRLLVSQRGLDLARIKKYADLFDQWLVIKKLGGLDDPE